MQNFISLEDKEDMGGSFAKYLESSPTPHTTPLELEALAYTLNIRMVILINKDQWFIFNKSADVVFHVLIVCDGHGNFYYLKAIQNPTAQLTREKYNTNFHLECQEKTSSFQEGTFNLPIKEILTVAEPEAMTDFTPEHDSLAKAHGYTIAPVPRNGLSVYYAVIDQLNRILNHNIPELSLAYTQYAQKRWLQDINKKPHNFEKKFSPGTFALPIRQILTFEEKKKNFSVDSTLGIFPDLQTGFQKFKDDITRLFIESPFQNSLVFKDITESQSKSQLVKIIEKFLTCRKLLFPKKNTLTIKLEIFLASYKPDEKEKPILMRENPPTPALNPYTEGHLAILNYSVVPLGTTKMTSAVSPASNNLPPPVSRSKPPKNRKPSNLYGKTGKHKCDFQGCNKRFDKNFTLTRHKKTHTKKKEFCCDVPGCNKKYSHKVNLKNHSRVAHEKIKFCCDVAGCSKKFSENASLKKHKFNIHTLPTISTLTLTFTSTSAEIEMPSTPAIDPAVAQSVSAHLPEMSPASRVAQSEQDQ